MNGRGEMMRLIDANKLKSVEKEIVLQKIRTPFEKDRTAILRVFEVNEIRNAPTVDAVPVEHGHWTDEHTCSKCGFEAFAIIRNIRPHYDYDWDENLVETGECDYDKDWVETNFCPNCGVKMDEVE